MRSKFGILILNCLAFVGGVGTVPAQALDISSGGTPTITGALNGSVTGSSSVLNDLVVAINFGEISPANTSSLVKVVVPIAVRSNRAYRVTASVSGATNANLQAVQRTDIGFGVNNFRVMGSRARNCARSNHIIYNPFNNNPANSVTINANGRATYPSTINNIVSPTMILSGPRLSQGNAQRRTDNGYIFDVIFTIMPQFYADGITSAVITFTISDGPNAPC